MAESRTERLFSAADRIITPFSEAWLRRAEPRAPTALARRCLVLAPHPDDESIGCGATIAGLVDAGAEVRIAVATDGRYGSFGADPDLVAETRHREARAAIHALGVAATDLVFWDFEDGTLSDCHDQLIGSIRETLASYPADTLFVTSRLDPHPDHRALAHAAMDVARSEGLRLLEYPIWSRRWPTMAMRSQADRAAWKGLRARRIRVVTGAWAERKCKAVHCYESQITEPSGDGPEPLAGPLDARFLGLFLGTDEYFFETAN